MKQSLKLSSAAIVFAFALPATAFAASATSSMAIGLTVSASCTIDNSTLTFVADKPTVRTGTADTQDTIAHGCTSGISPAIGVGGGGEQTQNAAGTMRMMSSGGAIAPFPHYAASYPTAARATPNDGSPTAPLDGTSLDANDAETIVVTINF